jgi:hypothetical protein
VPVGQPHQAVGLRVGKWPEQGSFDHAEDGRVGADTEGAGPDLLGTDVKATSRPRAADAKHVRTFRDEYPATIAPTRGAASRGAEHVAGGGPERLPCREDTGHHGGDHRDPTQSTQAGRGVDHRHAPIPVDALNALWERVRWVGSEGPVSAP